MTGIYDYIVRRSEGRQGAKRVRNQHYRGGGSSPKTTSPSRKTSLTRSNRPKRRPPGFGMTKPVTIPVPRRTK